MIKMRCWTAAFAYAIKRAVALVDASVFLRIHATSSFPPFIWSAKRLRV